MRGEQRWKARRIAARHAAFGRNAIDPRVTPRRRETRPVARRIVVMHEPEIELCFRVQPQSFERREKRVVRAVLWHRHMKILDRAAHAGADGVRHLDHDPHVLWLDEMLIGRAAIAEVIAELHCTWHRVADAGQYIERLRAEIDRPRLVIAFPGQYLLAHTPLDS